MDLRVIQNLIRQGAYEYSFHAMQERLEDDLDSGDVEAAILSGEIIERYPNDPRGESCLVLGFIETRPVHVVVGWASRADPKRAILRIVTVYVPHPPKWQSPRRRRGAP